MEHVFWGPEWCQQEQDDPWQQGSRDLCLASNSSVWRQPQPQGQQREEQEVEAKPTPCFSELGPVWRLKGVGLDLGAN